MKIVKPSSAQLRTVWPREDYDFTPWLADNLDFLDDVGLGDLECLETEVSVAGSARRLDILAATPDGDRVAIENQYRSIDHDHFTRGMAYAVGLNAKALVVIAEDHQDEFVALADYMNRCAEALGDQGIAVFLVTLRVETVGEFVAPRFDIRSEPNMWRSEILTSSTEKEISEAAHTRNQSRIKFWEDLLDVARTKSIEPWHRLKPRRGNHLTVSALPGVNVTWNIMVRAHEAYAKLWIDVGDAASNIAAFHSLQDEVDVSDLGFSLDWQSTERARACTVSSEPISGCGWSSNPQVRTPLFNDLLERERVFRTALEPHLAVVERHIP